MKALLIVIAAGLAASSGFFATAALGHASQSQAQQDKPAPPVKPADDPLFDAEFEADLNRTYDALDTYWRAVGTVDDDVVSYLMNPVFTGMPEWPSWTQSFSIVRTPDSLILASRGLSGPMPNAVGETINGFEMEVYIELPGAQTMTFDEIRSSAGFALVENAAAQVANWGGITGALDEYGVLSSELLLGDTSRLPDGVFAQSGGVPVLIGAPAAGRPAYVENPPFSPIRMVPVTYMTPAELQEVLQGGEYKRDRLVEALARSGLGHRSDIGRESVDF